MKKITEGQEEVTCYPAPTLILFLCSHAAFTREYQTIIASLLKARWSQALQRFWQCKIPFYFVCFFACFLEEIPLGGHQTSNFCSASISIL